MHVLCAPPAFILSQDQTLLFLVSISSVFSYLHINLFYKLLFKLKLLVLFVFFGSTNNYRLLVFSKDLLFTFQCTFFFPFLQGTFCIILHHILIVNIFFEFFNFFLLSFFIILPCSFFFLFLLLSTSFKAKEKTSKCCSIFMYFLLLIHIFNMFYFCDFAFPFCIIYLNIFIVFCQYFFLGNFFFFSLNLFFIENS